MALVVAAGLLGGCGSHADQRDKAPPQVGYAVMSESQVPLTVELPGRTSAYRIAQVRPQVSGVIEKQLFTEGSMVRAGQPLYRIDQSLYRAAVDQASANLTSAQATAEAARIKADRYKPLAADNAVAQQDYTDAAATARQSAASVAQNRAALQTARVNLRYTTVPAPVTGRIGRSLFTQGALATANQTDPLATISVLDPIYVDIQQSASDLMHLRRQLASGGAVAQTAKVTLKLDDGSDYGLPGTLEFSEVTVDTGTGTVALRAKFPNPTGLLMPGLFVRAQLAQAVQTRVVLVPQSAVSRDARGQATVYVLDGDKADIRAVVADRTQGDKWVVTQGLKAGDKVITQGLGKIRPGQKVSASPDSAPQQPLIRQKP
ncbi:MAG TPA: efflux RND transporter periplasmic adaptor subunit [Novosphingobium sp.]|nr:efflux RND transporter periplasmic adaptor subunit [Novosphingobium sp.]